MQTTQWYELWVAPAAEGVVSVHFAAGAVVDLAGNPSLPSTNHSFVFDAVTPVVGLTTATLPITNTVRTFFMTVSEVLFDLTPESFACGNCTVVSLVRCCPPPPCV